MSIFFIPYEVLMFICTAITPGSTFIMLVQALESTLNVNHSTSMVINGIPLILFILACFFGKEDFQILFSQILIIIYGLLLLAALISMSVGVINNGYFSTSALGFCLMFGPIFVAAILHPQVYISHLGIFKDYSEFFKLDC